MSGQAAGATTGRRFATDAIWVTLARINPQLNALILSVVAARIIGTNDLGRQSFIAFIEVSIIALLAESLANATSRHVARAIGSGDTDQIRPLYRWAQLASMVPAVVAGGTMFAISFGRPELATAWIVAGVSAILNCLNRAPSSVLGGMQRWRLLAICDVVLTVVGTVLAIVLLNLGYGITGMFVSQVVVSGAALIIYTMLARPAVRGLAPGRMSRLDPALRREALRYALLLSGGMIITLIVWRRSEFIFLDALSTDADIAMYSIAFAAVAALTQLPQAVSIVALPAFATLDGARSDDRVRSGIARAIRLTVLLTLPITAAALAGGPALIELAYGAEFAEAGRVLLIMLATFPPVAVILLVNGILQGVGRQRFPVIIGIVGAVLDIALALVLIPEHGARGAAVASAVAQLATGVPAILYVEAVMGRVVWPWRRIGACALASLAGYLAMAAVIATLPAAPGIVVGLAAGSVAFLAVALITPVMSSDDARWALGLTKGRGSRLISRLGRTASHVADAS